MIAKGTFLSWIVVADIEKAVKFYTEIMGLELKEYNKEFGWAELSGSEGALLGLAQENIEYGMKAGTNAVVTISVDDIHKAIEEMKQQGVRLIGDPIEIPGDVRMQTLIDIDGNMLQLVQNISLDA